MADMTGEGPSGALTVQFLLWLSEHRRTYGEAMDAWRTSCPRLSVWEDALSDGLIRLGEGRFRERQIVVTERGRSLLRDHRAAAPREVDAQQG